MPGLTNNLVASSDNTRVLKPIIPVKYNLKPGQTIIYKTTANGLRRPDGIVLNKYEQVSSDNRTNYQKHLDWKKAAEIQKKYYEDKNQREGELKLEALGRFYSPSTYVGAAAKSLEGDGKLADNVLSGKGFGDTGTNLMFDLVAPFALNKGVGASKTFLQNTAPGLFDPYTTFRGALGYYGNSLTDRILGTYGRRLHLPTRSRMPELFRSDSFATTNGIFDSADATKGRFPWQNLTTDTFVRDHANGHWSGNDIVIKNPSMYSPKGYLSTQPSDTFILKGNNNDAFNPKNYTLVSGNVDLLKKARAAGFETLSTPKLRSAFSSMGDAIERMESEVGNSILRAIKYPRILDEQKEYSDVIRNLLRKRGSATYGDYVYLSELTGLPITVSRTPFTIPGTSIEKSVGNPNLVFYDKSTPIESKLRKALNIGSRGISLEDRMASGMDNEFIRKTSENLNNELYGK